MLSRFLVCSVTLIGLLTSPAAISLADEAEA